MAIESVSGYKRYRVSPKNPCVVQVQERHGARWQLYHACSSADQATALVMQMGRDVKGTEVSED